MPRPRITYEQVAHVANQLVDQGVMPTIKHIRDELEEGSPTTIYRHLREWKKTQAPAGRRAVKLSDTLIQAMASEIERQTSLIRTELDDQAREDQHAADILAEIGEELEAFTEQLQSQVSRLEGERDAIIDERDSALSERERIRKAFNEQRLETDKVRELLTQAQARIKLLGEQRDEYYQSSMDTQRKLQAAKRHQLATERARVAAEAKQLAAEHNASDLREALKAEQSARKLDADAVRKDIAQMRHEWKERQTALEQSVYSAEQRAISAERARSKAEIQLNALKSQDGVRAPGKRRTSPQY